MFITALWVRSTNEDTGINLYLYEHPEGIPEEIPLANVENDPRMGNITTPVKAKIGMQPGSNHVRAELCVVLRRKEYRSNLNDLLEQFELDKLEKIDHGYFCKGDDEWQISFTVERGLETPKIMCRIFTMLKKSIIEWDEIPLLEKEPS